MSRLRRLHVSDRCFFITGNLLREAPRLTDDEFVLLAEAISSSRKKLRFALAAWVLMPDHWHAIIFPAHPCTISEVMKAAKQRSDYFINRQRGHRSRIWQPRFFDRILRTVKEYNETVEYIHLNPVRRGLAARPEDWKWSSIHDYGGPLTSALEIDRLRLPVDEATYL